MGSRPPHTGTSQNKNCAAPFQPHPRSLHRKYFRQTLLLLLANALIPVFIVGTMISFFTLQNLRKTADDNNYNLLAQFQSNVENIINEINYMNIEISVNSNLYYTLQKTMTHPRFDSISANPSAAVNPYLIPLIATRDYIDSMYIYIDNDLGRFISIPEGLCRLDSYPDTSWLEGYEENKNREQTLWSKPRSYQKYSFLKEKTDVISIYQKFYYHQGVSIINLSADYFVKELKSLSLAPGQTILAVNDAGEILFQNNSDNSSLTEPLLKDLSASSSEIIPNYTYQGQRYYIVQLFSELGNIHYVSITPHASLYRTVYNLMTITLSLMLVLTILCIGISSMISHRFHQNIMQIIDLFAAAEKELPLPATASRNNLYGILTQNIIKTFVAQNTLKMQLRENIYQNKILELNSLQAQISPHFLFNTLKSIFWMSFQLTASKNPVCEMIENMTDILDYSLSEYDTLVPLEMEIKNTKSYITIQQMRYNSRFSVSWEYSEKFSSFHTIKLLIQPLIENCITHAFTWEKEYNRIKIKLYRRNQDLILKVIDNGMGIQKEELVQIQERLASESAEGHIGIFNNNRRLSLTFGPSYGLSIKSKAGMGTLVTAVFPCITSAPPQTPPRTAETAPHTFQT